MMLNEILFFSFINYSTRISLRKIEKPFSIFSCDKATLRVCPSVGPSVGRSATRFFCLLRATYAVHTASFDLWRNEINIFCFS